MKTFNTIILETETDYATLWLNRPEKKNAMNQEMISEIREAIQVLESDPSIRFLIIRGKGDLFCSGADLKWVESLKDKTTKQIEEETLNLSKMMHLLYQSDLITISMVQGSCHGGGLGLISVCDFILSDHDTKFSLSEAKIGLVPAIISPYITEKIGVSNTRQLMLSSDIISAEKALSIGLIFEQTVFQAFDKKVNEILNKLRVAGPEAQKTIKELMRNISSGKINTASIETTSALLAEITVSAEATEGISAFLKNANRNGESQLKIMNLIKKILIANRGEIAVRIERTIKELGLTSVAIFTDEETNALHVKNADLSKSIGSGELAETYLNIDKIIQIAKEFAVDAIHPGYGFLSENAKFARKCEENKFIFIGPQSEIIELMGKKDEAIAFVKKEGIPVLNSICGDLDSILKQIENYDYPIIIKAVAGGGGKGMSIVNTPEEFEESAQSAARMAKKYFGNDQLIVEKYLVNARHIEVQILGDHYGNIIHLFERECSIQRRYQKIIEEAPSPSLNDSLREKVFSYAIKIAEKAKYRNAGTIEFLLSEEGEFYFLEMNTRIQVEHPVTEAITGMDIVKEQIKIAQGEELVIKQEEIPINGHAIEARIYAENPVSNFQPSGGIISNLNLPNISNIRFDTFIQTNEEIGGKFDPMIAKVIAHGKNRNSAINNLKTYLGELQISGISTNQSFLSTILENKNFCENEIDVKFIEKIKNDLLNALKRKADFLKEIAAISFFQKYFQKEKIENVWEYFNNSETIQLEVNNTIFHIKNKGLYRIELNGKNVDFESNTTTNSIYHLTAGDNKYTVFSAYNEEARIEEITIAGFQFKASTENHLNFAKIKKSQKLKKALNGNFTLKSTLYGQVLSLKVGSNQSVKEGDILLTIESMKSENEILSPHNGIVKTINIKEGSSVKDDMALLILELN